MRKPAPGVRRTGQPPADFSHQGKPEFAPLNLIEVIDQAVFVLNAASSPNHCRLDPPAQTPWLARADCAPDHPGAVQSRLNARDAMPQGGRSPSKLANRSFSPANSRGPQIPGICSAHRARHWRA